MVFKDSSRAKDVGLFVLTTGIGLIFIGHGYPKIVGGAEKWVWLGNQMAHLGITIAPVFWGFMAASAEFFGGILLVLGLATRIAAFFMGCVMATAVTMHLSQGDGFSGAAYALSMLVIFITIFIAGGGAYSMDALLSRKK